MKKPISFSKLCRWFDLQNGRRIFASMARRINPVSLPFSSSGVLEPPLSRAIYPYNIPSDMHKYSVTKFKEISYYSCNFMLLEAVVKNCFMLSER